MRIDDSSIRVNRHTCIACGICVDRCIMDNLRLSVAPCRQACPLNMNCQGYIRLLAMGKEAAAVEQLLPYGPFVDLIAQNCSAPCEKACVRGKKDGAVHILALKQYLARKYSDDLNRVSVPDVLSGKRVAVIGAGVSGLACGFRVLRAGHAVTLFTQPSEQGTPHELESIVTSLEAAGAVFAHRDQFEDKSRDMREFDAIILSGPKDRAWLDSITREKVMDGGVDPLTHHIEGRIFSAKTNESDQKIVFEIAGAFETVESVNRFLNGEPFDWGRGFYTQGGAVKAFSTDARVGVDVARAPREAADGGFDRETAREQASRCFGCGRAFEKNQTCWYCLPCELECPQEALQVDIPYLVR